MQIHQLPIDQALAALGTRPAGLSAAEARTRVAAHGPNTVSAVGREHLLVRFGREFSHLFAVILWIAAALAFAAEWHQPGEGMASLGVAIVGVIVLNGVFSFWQEYRAERALAALRSLLPQRVKVVREGETLQLDAVDLVPGDIMVLAEGDDVPADGRFIECFGLRVNNATLTGESLPVARDAAPTGEPDVLRARNVALAGTSVLSGEGRAVVFATGMRTEFGRIAHLAQSASEPPSPLQREIRRLSHLVAALATTLGIGFFLIGQALGLPFLVNFIFAIGIIVANVPEGLLPTVTLSLAMATQRMARRRAVVRHLPAVEALGATTVIVSDKTGTLTQNRMQVREFCTAIGRPTPVTGDAAALPRRLLETAARCESVRELREGKRVRLGGDPMEIALTEFAARAGVTRAGFEHSGEIPFDADRKRMSVSGAADGERVLYCKGARETVLPVCHRAASADGETPLGEAVRGAIVAAEAKMAERGLRVLAFAWRRLAPDEPDPTSERELTFLGLLGLEDPPRPEVPAAMRSCHEAGIRVIMVTGDHPATARAIAREVGLTAGDPVVVTGDELRALSDSALERELAAPDILFARVAADQKMRIVNGLRARGEVVAVTGDGVNDAPALKAADIGIAMGLAGTDVAKAAADIVLLDDNFATIVSAVEEGRSVFANIRKFLTYILTSNIPELVPYLAFALFHIPLPLTVIQILAVDLGTDLLPALALGAEKPDPGVMQVPPRPRGERLLNASILLRAYLFLGVLEAAGAMAAYFLVLHLGGWSGEQLATDALLYRQATTACLTTIIVMQIANVFLCRHPVRSAFSFAFGENRLILVGVAVEVLLLVFLVFSTPGQMLFGTAPVPAATWVLMLGAAAAMVVLEETRKAIVRRGPGGASPGPEPNRPAAPTGL
ncbi:MAG: cation-transporting P-type ATPase [Burkholderiales bacterium]|nr:cation-transporting P-type ATPase [Burkholderiales bacterium]